MHELNFVNPQINNIKSQELSIQVSLSGFSFLIRSSDIKKCLMFRHYSFKNSHLIDELIRKVESIIYDEDILKNDFTSTDVYYVSQKATLIPKEFFDPNNLRSYFELNHTLAELDELHYSYISELDAYSVFSIPNYLADTIFCIQNKAKIKHQSVKLISYALGVNEINGISLFIGINQDFFDMVVVEDKKLLLYNSFEYSNAMDFVYFFLYACKQLKIDVDNQIVHALGETEQHKDVIKELRAKVKEVVIPDVKVGSGCKNVENKQSARFYNLFLP